MPPLRFLPLVLHWIKSHIILSINILKREEFFFFGCIGIKFRTLFLLGKCSTTWDMTPSLFASGYFWDMVLFYAWSGLVQDHLICASLSSWGWQVHPTTPSHWLRWVLWTFCLGWPWTAILPISSSQIARIAGLSHYTWTNVRNF
jgi:hypothetical protein